MAPNPSNDPFTTEDLIDVPDLGTFTSHVWHGFQLQKNPESGLLALADPQKVLLDPFRPDVLKLALDDEPLPDLGGLAQSLSSSSENEEPSGFDVPRKVEEEDVWKLPEVQKQSEDNRLISWDHFLDAAHDEPRTKYLTEAPVAVFDTILCKVNATSKRDDDLKYAKSDVFLHALFDLGLGRGSGFFAWDEKDRRFGRLVQDYTVSGLSVDALEALVDRFMKMGTCVRELSSLQSHTSRGSPTRIAFAGAISSVLTAIYHRLEAGRKLVKSLIQLEDLFGEFGPLLKQLATLSGKVDVARTDVELVVSVIAYTETIFSEGSRWQKTFNHITSRVLQPSIRHFEMAVGLRPEEPDIDSSQNELLLRVLRGEVQTLGFEASTALSLLARNAPENALLTVDASQRCGISIDFSADAVARLQKKADKYERDLKAAILLCRKSDESDVDSDAGSFFPASESLSLKFDDSSPFVFEFGLFNDIAPALQHFTRAEKLTLQDHNHNQILSEDSDLNPLSLTCQQALESSIAPILTAQHRLLSFSILQVLIQDHSLVSHLDLLHQFQLFGHGTFASQLTTALFDADQASGEGKRATNAKTGLRLQARDTWPPASSELRLVLIDILSNSMSTGYTETLNESISFAIRDLTDEELDRCRDVDSIHALDFLRLQYKAPNTILESVITSKSLDCYDAIFKHLLRLLRLKSLAQSLSRQANSRNAERKKHDSNAQKLRIQIQHFISTLADYTQTSVITSAWSEFSQTVQNMRRHIQKWDYDSALTMVSSLDELRRIHESTLDKIMHGLLLQPHQRRNLELLEHIWDDILKFAAFSNTVSTSTTSKQRSARKSTATTDTTTATDVKQMQVNFTRKVTEFIRDLKSVVSGIPDNTSEASAELASSPSREMLEQLLLRLDWNGYYSKK